MRKSRSFQARPSDAAKFAFSIAPMRPAPIPHRIPPLAWRKPALLWTPLALAAAIGWPALALANDGGLAQLALICGATAFAIGLITLGASWAFGHGPQSRRAVILHVLCAGLLVALAAPFAMTGLLAQLAELKSAGAGAAFTFSMSLSMVPLALLLGLPIALLSGIVFSMLALSKARGRDVSRDDVFRRHDVQPFR